MKNRHLDSQIRLKASIELGNIQSNNHSQQTSAPGKHSFVDYGVDLLRQGNWKKLVAPLLLAWSKFSLPCCLICLVVWFCFCEGSNR
jgi:hypothetical protein